MEFSLILQVWPITILLPAIALLLLHRRQKSYSTRLPPGPAGWPIFGHIFHLGTMPYRTLSTLGKTYGPVVWLKLGSKNTMVVLTAEAAGELFKNHDLSFADRAITHILESHDYYKSSLSFAPYGAKWRLLKRICTIEMIVTKKLNETALVRQKCVDNMLKWIEEEAQVGKTSGGRGGVEVARFVFLASFNALGNLMFSRDLVEPNSEEASKLYTAMLGVVEWSGLPNISDFFPSIRWLDLQGLRRKMDRDFGEALEIVFGFVKERLKERQDGSESKNDYLDVLLDFEGNGKDEPAKLSERDISISLLEILFAGSESSSTTIEWTLIELLCNPSKMAEVKAELNRVVGPNRKFEESDIQNMHYLQAVMKEALRLHPPFPFLLPRNTIQDTEFMGYRIPKDTQVFVNAWAIGRDPECWDDPTSFKPERFLGSKVDYKGQHFELIPFGAGRRICAGLPLAQRMIHFVMGSLLQEYDWELESHAANMEEKMGITVKLMEPLKAVPKRSRV